MPHLVDEHRAAFAARSLVGSEHEVVEQELAAPVEEVDEARLPVRALEHVILADQHPRQAPALGCERVVSARELLLLRPEPPEGRLPLLRCDGPRLAHLEPPSTHGLRGILSTAAPSVAPLLPELLLDGSNYDAPEPRRRPPRRQLDRFVPVARLDQEEATQVLLRLGEWPIDHGQLSASNRHDRGGPRALEGVGADQLTALPEDVDLG